MKKVLVFISVFSLITALAFGANFLPTKLVLSVAPTIHYDFDGKNLSIPVTITGTNASLIFLVYTKGQAESIGKIRNGNLGWHYVNGIDTCMYYSSPYAFERGKQTVTWNGKNQDGKAVTAGEYAYYMWAFDNVSAKQRATVNRVLFDRNILDVQEYDEAGLPLAHPFIHGKCLLTPATESSCQILKWTLGNDPYDENLFEFSNFDQPEKPEGVNYEHETGLFDPKDFGIVYTVYRNYTEKTLGVQKWNWVPNGAADLQTSWGETWSHGAAFGGAQGTRSDGTYIYFACANSQIAEPMCFLEIVDFEGSLVEAVSLDGWFIRPDEYFRENGSNYLNPPYSDVTIQNVRKGKFFMGTSCMWTMQDPQRYLETGELDDLIAWANMNGDGINDKGWQTDSPTPWICYSEGPPHLNGWLPDSNYFVAGSQYDMGAVSFSLMAPDGTGLGNSFAFAGETAGYKRCPMYVQNGSAYDGMYPDNQAGETDTQGTWFIGHDSIKGVITNKVLVADDQPSVFSVGQNSPNPFNPTTTISFTLSKANTVSIDIYNVAGQKIDTVANDFMGAGSHSVVWNASSFAAGVYFYTVKSGDYSETMKMTLLK